MSDNLGKGMGNSTKFISWNVKGANNIVKRQKILSHLQQLKVDIAFLQETHLCNAAVSSLKRNWVGQVYHSKFNAKARGTAILINKNISFHSQEVISDPNGRYIIVVGQLFANSVILVNLYAPNCDDSNFFERLFLTIPKIDHGYLVVGGDFNLVLDATLDRSSTNPQRLSRSAGVVNDFMGQCGLSDVWRFQFPHTRVYSFFSNVHHSYTRIDYFLLDNRLLPRLKRCSYTSIVISDHSAIFFDLDLPNRPPRNRIWRFSPLLLSDENFVEFISSQIDFFLETNTTPGISYATLWETLKVYIRGQIIAYTSSLTKKKKSRLQDISQQIADIDSKYAQSPTPNLYKDRLRLQTEYDLLTTDEATHFIMKVRYNTYEFGDKASRLLAMQARQAAASRSITKIQSNTGEILTDHNDINNTFLQFYSDLYTSECSNDSNLPHTFFENLILPAVSEEQNAKLGADVSISEIVTAINLMQNNKSPGPDGFTSEFYKKFALQLAPTLGAMFKEAFSVGILPMTLRQASVSLLAKKDKDPLLCSSYRPISLLNVDFKILSKVLARRLENVIPDIISPNQTGFIRGRHSYSNLRKLFNIIHSARSEHSEVVISLDAEKAFDRVEWKHLFFTLRKFGFSEGFIAWIELLYSSPLASIISNGTQSAYFPLERGTRQGCPLSPLLFGISIEPLAVALRLCKDFKGIQRDGLEFKVSLYADDLLLYVSDLESSLPPILDILKQFGRISGYKLNLQKSELFSLQAESVTSLSNPSPFKRVQNGFKYLGIEITHTWSTTFAKNFTTLLNKCKQDMNRWASLPLSIVGRINLIKMIVLPKFIYLFQSIPVLIKKSFFKKMDQIIIPFIWGNKPSRISKTHLQRPKCSGGLALPNFLFYYWACNISKIIHWLEDKPMMEKEDWVRLEFSSCPHNLGSVICAALPLICNNLTSNTIANHSIRIWAQFRKHFGIQGPSILSPIKQNHMFIPSCTDPTFSQWFDKGIKSICNLYIDNTFASFSHLSQTYNLPKNHFFRYLQVRSFVQKTFHMFPNKPIKSHMDHILELKPDSRGLIAQIYDLIQKIDPYSTENLRKAWESDLGIVLRDDQWDSVFDLINTSSLSAKHSLIQLKVVHRVHFTRARLAKIYPNLDPLCPRCRGQPADLIHMFWLCPNLSTFWTTIFKAYSDMFGTRLDPDPISALFGVVSEESRAVLPLKAHVVIAFTTLLARRLILFKWKQNTPPSFTHWVKDVMYFLHLEKIKYTLRGSSQSFLKIWRPFLDYYDTLQVPLDSNKD